MTRPTRTVRAERIARDDGDPDDAVWTSSGYNNSNRYHAREDCPRTHTDQEMVRRTRTEAQDRHRAPCLWCVLEEDTDYTERDYSGTECPFCDERVFQLPGHLREDCLEVP